VWVAIDLVLRFAYVAGVLFMLPILAIVMPITGMLISTGIATLVALIGSEAWHARVDRVPFVGRLLGGIGKLADFYREHPPKPLVYYIFYPALLPVILFLRVPRREFLLYRKLNVLALVIVAATGAWDYFRNWRPELTFGQFAASTFAMFVLQLVIAVMLIMPLVTTLVVLRRRGLHKTLAGLVLLMAAAAALGALGAHKSRTMSVLTWTRIKERTQYARAELVECERDHPNEVARCVDTNPAIHALKDGLVAAIAVARDHPDDTAAQLDAARDKLREYYKPDEANAFDVVSSEGVAVIYVKYPRKPPIWLGVGRHGFFARPQMLPQQLAKLIGL
jgi:hypothetical protein